MDTKLYLSVPNLPDVIRLTISSKTATLAADTEVPVAYDPADPAKTATTSVFTYRNTVTGALAVGMVLAGAWFVFNLKMRNNAEWQNVSGVVFSFGR